MFYKLSLDYQSSLSIEGPQVVSNLYLWGFFFFKFQVQKILASHIPSYIKNVTDGSFGVYHKNTIVPS